MAIAEAKAIRLGHPSYVWRRRQEDRAGPPDLWGRGLALSGLICFALTFPIVYAPLMRVALIRITGRTAPRGPASVR